MREVRLSPDQVLDDPCDDALYLHHHRPGLMADAEGVAVFQPPLGEHLQLHGGLRFVLDLISEAHESGNGIEEAACA